MTDPSERPKVKVALICEDVRKEANGKEIIIGVMGGDLVTPQFPAGVMFTLYLRIRFPREGNFPAEIRVLGPPTDQPVTPVAKINIVSSGSGRDTTLALAGIPIQIMTPGKIQFQWRPEGEKEWETLADLDVKQGEVNITGVTIGQGTIAS